MPVKSKLIHKKPKRVNINPLMLDPTRTTTLRRQFSQSLSGRLNILSQRVTKLIAGENALGIGITTGYALNTRWMFNTTSEQVSAFMKWFMEQAQELLYDQEENSWWKEYVVRSYNQGAGSAWSKWRDKSRFLQDAFNNPVQIERVKTLAGRVLTELKNVTQAMATTMSRTLTDGLAQGKNPRVVAKELNATVQGLGKNRANMIAQTETIRAHASGTLDALENLGMQNVGVMVEWSTSGLGTTRVIGKGKNKRGGNPSPCHLCKPLQGAVFTIEQARGLLPRHPNCRCSLLPAGVGEDTTGQKLGKKAVSAALTASIKAEIPPTSKRTLAEQRSRTSWAGGTKVINRKVENFNPNHDDLGRFSGVSSTASGEDASLWETGGVRHMPSLRPGQIVSPPHKQSEVGEETPFHVRKKGVGGDEIYNPLPTTKVKVNDLKTMQPLVEEQRLKVWDQSKADPIHVMIWKGQPYITQGNHRAASAWAAGVHEIEAKVLDLDKPANWKYLQPKIRKRDGLTTNFNPNHDKEGKFAHAQSATHDFLKSMDSILQSSAKAHADHVYHKMAEVEIGVDRGALVAVRDLRKVSGLSKQQFDQAVYDLAKEGRVSAHRHDFAASLAPHELAELVDTSIGDPSRVDLPANHGRYWVGIARKRQ